MRIYFLLSLPMVTTRFLLVSDLSRQRTTMLDSTEVTSNSEDYHKPRLNEAFRGALIKRNKITHNMKTTPINRRNNLEDTTFISPANSTMQWIKDPNSTQNASNTAGFPRENSFVSFVLDRKCENVASCLYPYVSYFAMLIMFFLIMYFMIVFGRCVFNEIY